MHYTRDFSTLDGQEKIDAALNATREYLGDAQFTKIIDALATYPKPDLERFAMMMSLAGVQGYPVEAIYATVWN